MQPGDVDVDRASLFDLVALVTQGIGRVRADAALAELARADPFALADAIAPRRTARTLRAARALAAAFELGRRAEIARVEARELMASPADVARWAGPRLVDLAHEELWMLGVDGRGHVRAARCVARGGLHGAAFRPADPLRAALRVDASAFILVHNHPSGDPTPSREDVVVTEEIARAGHAAGVALLDHVVVARSGFACVPFPT